MRPISKALLFAGVLSLGALSGASFAQAPGPVRPTPPAPVAAPRPAATTAPRAPVAPKKKPNAVRRMFNRIGTFLGADEEMGTTPTYRDPSTGRTNTGGSKPYLKRMEQ